MEIKPKTLHIIANRMFLIPAFTLNKKEIRDIFNKYIDYVYCKEPEYEYDRYMPEVIKGTWTGSDIFIKNFGQLKCSFNNQVPYTLDYYVHSKYDKSRISKNRNIYNCIKLYSTYFCGIGNYQIKIEHAKAHINVRPIIHILPHGVVNVIFSSYVKARVGQTILSEDINEICNIINGNFKREINMSISKARFSKIRNMSELFEEIKGDIIKSLLKEAKDTKNAALFKDRLSDGIFINILDIAESVNENKFPHKNFIEMCFDIIGNKNTDYKQFKNSEYYIDYNHKRIFLNRKRWIMFSDKIDEDYYYSDYLPKNTLKSWSIYRIFEFARIENLTLKFINYSIRANIINEIRCSQINFKEGIRTILKRTFYDANFFNLVEEYPELKGCLYGYAHKVYKSAAKELEIEEQLKLLEDRKSQALDLINEWKPGIVKIFMNIKDFLF